MQLKNSVQTTHHTRSSTLCFHHLSLLMVGKSELMVAFTLGNCVRVSRSVVGFVLILVVPVLVGVRGVMLATV